MTREERDKAIRILQWLHDNNFLFASTEEDVKYATKLAIQELKQQPCEDAISRQAVIDVIKSMSNANPSYWNKCDVVDREDLIDEISELPSVKQEPKTGHWILRPHIYGVAFCSECGFELKINNTNYCPNCGAKMVKPQESEDKE